jgi:hypothetical protein
MTPTLPGRFLALLCVGLSACAGAMPHAAESNVSVYKSRGGLQCENNAIALSELEKQLKDGGIAVAGSSCGHDGRMRPAMCGRPDGRIAIFDIPASKLEAAAALKFLPLAKAEGATRSAC